MFPGFLKKMIRILKPNAILKSIPFSKLCFRGLFKSGSCGAELGGWRLLNLSFHFTFFPRSPLQTIKPPWCSQIEGREYFFGVPSLFFSVLNIHSDAFTARSRTTYSCLLGNFLAPPFRQVKWNTMNYFMPILLTYNGSNHISSCDTMWFEIKVSSKV